MTGTRGWAVPDTESKSHFIIDGVSLCKLWQYTGTVTPSPRPMGHHCRICAQKADKR
jgi:hypothetical protein